MAAASSENSGLMPEPWRGALRTYKEYRSDFRLALMKLTCARSTAEEMQTAQRCSEALLAEVSH
jgi:hypothetical protein